MSYNCHSIPHVTQDIQTFEPFENYSCFDFENVLGQIKTCLRSGNNPVAQIRHRLTEAKSLGLDLFNNFSNTSAELELDHPHLNGPICEELRGIQYMSETSRLDGLHLEIS